MQKEHVILYGFGWVGQSMLAFCEAMGFECRAGSATKKLALRRAHAS